MDLAIRAKTFILSPLKKVYNAFCNPATGSFAWVGAEDAEVILLKDFRWNPGIIARTDFLQVLEGDIVHLLAPKNFCKQDVEFSKDKPFSQHQMPLLFWLKDHLSIWLTQR